MVRIFSLCAGLLAPLLLARTSGATVWTVSPPGGGGQFTTIQGAIDAAAPGDTILVMAGSYTPFVLDKAIRILGVGPSLVTVSVTLPSFSGGAVVGVITGVTAGGIAMVAGMRILVTDGGPASCGGAFGPMPNHAVTLTNCSAPVVLSNLDLEPGHNGRGIRADSSAVLILDHVSAVGAPWGCGTLFNPCFSSPCVGEGIWTAGTNVSLNDGLVLGIPTASALQVDGPAQALVARTGLQGADGVTISTFFGGAGGTAGGHGLEATSGASVRIAAGPGAFAAGGNGGQGGCGSPFTGQSGPGGDAIRATAANVLRAPDLTLTPGAGVNPGGFSASAPGSAVSGSTVLAAAAPLPSLGVSPVLASPGGAVALDVRGAAGSLNLVGVAQAPAFLSIVGVGGPLLLDPATLVVPFSGILDVSGSASIPTALPPDPLLSTAVLFLQPATIDPTGPSLGPAVSFVVL